MTKPINWDGLAVNQIYWMRKPKTNYSHILVLALGLRWGVIPAVQCCLYNLATRERGKGAFFVHLKNFHRLYGYAGIRLPKAEPGVTVIRSLTGSNKGKSYIVKSASHLQCTVVQYDTRAHEVMKGKHPFKVSFGLAFWHKYAIVGKGGRLLS